MSNDSRQNNEVFGAQQAQQAGFQTRNIMKDDFGYEVPVESIPLPSSGIIYPPETGLFGKETLEIRAMTAKEEDILTSRALIKKGTVITELIKSCLVDKTINVDDMIAGDRNAVMTALRITGYGSDYNVQVDCPECGSANKKTFMLTDLPIKRLGIQPVVEGANLFEFDLPMTGKKVQFKFLTGKDETEMSTIAERQKKQGMKLDSLITSRLQYSIVTIDGINERNKINMFVKNMPARDSLALRKFIDSNEPGIEMKSWMQCDSCDEHAEVSLPLGASFFWPDAE
jgi:hypothetical protein